MSAMAESAARAKAESPMTLAEIHQRERSLLLRLRSCDVNVCHRWLTLGLTQNLMPAANESS